MIDEDLRLRAGCGRSLSYHGPADPRSLLKALADRPEAALAPDFYGNGGAVAQLEARTAALLGKPAASFMIKGVTAQLVLLRALTEIRTGAVVIPALGHMAVDEADAVDHLIAAPVIRLGGDGPYDVADLEALDETPAICVVELPLRRAAYRLLPLDALAALSEWCRARGVHLHVDGARIWEAAAGYGVSPAAIAALADSVYVSFYKGLGGLAGAALAGDHALLDMLKSWKTRLGGDLSTAFPYALAAFEGLDTKLPRMADYVARARTLAASLAERGLGPLPGVPHTNAFRILLPGVPDILTRANRAFARRHGIWLFNGFEAMADDRSAAEIVIGEAAMVLSDAEIAGWIGDMTGDGAE
ncbi:threonine aldolase family protein [Sphingomonas colocasiae]|uniref:Threonine aldolase n=1 Tax=Sphingomonas colocasiae TaxID=1848973 RepID=A0ABS7PYE2_9SPHN|nr:beta-eliminating lyase-related protein [Sphingomonas colocasiae]MBY8826358.1 threonine aldolase [Sphingomonas colocasiae]